MAEKLDPKEVVTFEELLRALMLETDGRRKCGRSGELGRPTHGDPPSLGRTKAEG